MGMRFAAGGRQQRAATAALQPPGGRRTVVLPIWFSPHLVKLYGESPFGPGSTIELTLNCYLFIRWAYDGCVVLVINSQ